MAFKEDNLPPLEESPKNELTKRSEKPELMQLGIIDENIKKVQMNSSQKVSESGIMDVYENDDMIDCFMDDIDEMSMCEGSIQKSQQDFNYNATGAVIRNRGTTIMDQNN